MYVEARVKSSKRPRDNYVQYQFQLGSRGRERERAHGVSLFLLEKAFFVGMREKKEKDTDRMLQYIHVV